MPQFKAEEVVAEAFQKKILLFYYHFFLPFMILLCFTMIMLASVSIILLCIAIRF